MVLKLVTVVGKPGCGMTTAAKQIAQKFGCTYVSARELLSRSLGKNLCREDYMAQGVKLGPQGKIKLFYSELPKTGRAVLNRAITTDEIQELKQRGSFILFCDTPKDVCVQRILMCQDSINTLRSSEDILARAEEIYDKDLTDLESIHKIANYQLDTDRKFANTDTSLFIALDKYFREE